MADTERRHEWTDPDSQMYEGAEAESYWVGVLTGAVYFQLGARGGALPRDQGSWAYAAHLAAKCDTLETERDEANNDYATLVVELSKEHGEELERAAATISALRTQLAEARAPASTYRKAAP